MFASLSENGFPTQTFAGNELDRSASLPDGIIIDRPTECLVTLLSGRKLCVAREDECQDVLMVWILPADAEDLAGVAFNYENEACDKITGEPRTVIHLGRGQQDGIHRIALAVPAEVIQLQRVAEKLTASAASMEDTRQLLPLLNAQQATIAGAAVALIGWHEANLFCGKCGASTVSIQCGAKRVCTANPRHRLYPRTDPVVIMVVEDVAGDRILLGRRAKGKPGQFTALSGFLDAGESIEEAVCREVLEEAGLKVNNVSIIGSQPWPIGRAGSNELMIACCAQATHNDHNANPSEMEEVQWFQPDVLQNALVYSTRRENPFAGGNGVLDSVPAGDDGVANGDRTETLWVPPPYAIAHHLIAAWVATKLDKNVQARDGEKADKSAKL